MDNNKTLNEFFNTDVLKVNCTLVPSGFNGTVRWMRAVQESLSNVIDTLGEQSAAAQGLNKTITTAAKLRQAPDHFVYLLKDSGSHGGRGEVIGLLKVGRKHLYLHDERERPWQGEALCVLDFFVLPDHQRRGHGRLLFDHMLQDMQCSPHHLAIDGPSLKMERFLAKSYGVERLLRQSNNFAVSAAFFEDANNVSKPGPSLPPAETPTPVGRYSAYAPASDIATVIHGGGGGGGGRSPRATTPVCEPPRRSPAAVPQPELPAPPGPGPARPCSLRVQPAAGPAPPSAAGEAPPESRRDSQVTERGYFDVKFYHNKLW